MAVLAGTVAVLDQPATRFGLSLVAEATADSLAPEEQVRLAAPGAKVVRVELAAAELVER